METLSQGKSAGQSDEAISQARETIELFGSECPYETLVTAKAYNQKGMYQEAIAALEKRRAFRLADGTLENNPRIIAELGYAYALAGRRDDAQEIVAELEASRGYVDPYLIALVHAALGDKDEAFRWLEQAYQRRTSYISFLKSDPEFAPLREDPRFTDLLRRMNLPT